MSARAAAIHAGSLPPAYVDFIFERLQVEKVILHPIQVKDESGSGLAPPAFSTEVLVLPAAAMQALQSRLTEALKKKSHSVEMSIESADEESFFQHSGALLNGNEKKFISTSQWMAKKLASAQISTSADPGMLCVIRGRVGAQSKRFVAVIKADVVDGFSSREGDIAYLERLFLTPSQRLYKIGVLVEVVASKSDADGMYDASNYRAFLFDHLLTATETKNAAAYFYHSLLGFGLQKSAKKERVQNFV
jgi:ABC-type transport system involved in Fe-S cluster assembly fused permease/ATPase subunit